MTWEYKTVSLATGGLLGGKFDPEKLDEVLNDLGAEGWELTSAFDTNQSYGATRDIVAIFRRQSS